MNEACSVNNTFHHLSRDEFNDLLKQRLSNPRYPSRNPSSNVSTSKDFSDSYVYNFDHLHRGLALIINNEKYGTKHREGSHYDEIALNKSFGHLGFHVEIFRDLTAEQMLLVAKAAAALYGHGDADCFVFAILSHGAEMETDREDQKTIVKKDVLFGVDDVAIGTGIIVDCFSDKNCSSLIGKPRLFFIQACRGPKLDDGVKVKDLGKGELVCLEDEAARPPNPEPRGSVDKVTIRPTILYPDCLIMYASPPGYFAWTRKEGSWFIQELCKFLDSDNVGSISFVRGLTSVCRKVAWQYESVTGTPETSGKKGMPVVDTQLLNEIYITRHKEQ